MDFGLSMDFKLEERQNWTLMFHKKSIAKSDNLRPFIVWFPKIIEKVMTARFVNIWTVLTFEVIKIDLN